MASEIASPRAPKRKAAALALTSTPKRANDGLISHRFVPVAQKAVYRHNAIQSPLLILPAEIRQRICQYAIGGYHKHVETKFDPSLHLEYSCIETCPPAKPQLQDRHVYVFDWTTLAWPGQYNTGPQIPRPLATVCRQLHQKMSLLILEANLFSFDNAFTLKKFLQPLKPVQIRALRNLAFSTGWSFEKSNKSVFKQLNGLVEVFMVFPVFSDWENDCQWKRNTWLMTDVEAWKSKCGQIRVVHNYQDDCKTCKGGM